jgi:hypothetical protein
MAGGQSACAPHRLIFGRQTAVFGWAGKGETVVQETTSGPGDGVGSVNPTRSKLKQCASEGGPPEYLVAPRSRWLSSAANVGDDHSVRWLRGNPTQRDGEVLGRNGVVDLLDE